MQTLDFMRMDPSALAAYDKVATHEHRVEMTAKKSDA